MERKIKITKAEREEHNLWLKEQKKLDKTTTKSIVTTLPKQINKSGLIR
jgi:hypothetical protein